MVKMDFDALDVGGAVRCTDDSSLASRERPVRIQKNEECSSCTGVPRYKYGGFCEYCISTQACPSRSSGVS